MKTRLILAAFTLLLLPGAAWAMINPQEFLDEAPEKAEIEIVSVWLEKGSDRHVRTAMVARVASVERSKAGLRKGDVILIVYTIESPEIDKKRKEHAEQMKGKVGAQFLEPPPAPKLGQKVVAFLKPNSDGQPANRVFEPGSHQYSFEPAP